ncbi:MAG: lipocalin [Verrucomicrobiaceae bacterium]|nr:MAG: lipocalin [Verrucomicrobiaceae bacterium]
MITKPAIRHAALSIIGLVLASCSAPKVRLDAPPTAEHVDLARYTGRWHEIARLPAPFQKDDEAAIADYGMNADGTVSVHNIAVRRDGSQRGIKGSAKVLNPPANTKLAVRFDTWFGPLIPVPEDGNYWILHVDERYQEAIVGTPDRKFLWLLARTPEISAQRKAALVAKAEALGFEVARLVTTQRH